MSGWYSTRDTSTWFEASDAQAWIPSNQTLTSTVKSQDLKNGKSEANRLSKEVKLENRRSINTPTQQTQSYFELPSNSVARDQNAWNAYVLSNTQDSEIPSDPNAPTDPNASSKLPEKVVFSKLKRNVEIEEELMKQNLYKTELCQSWMETGACRYGPKCQYAHGKDEVRPVIRHPKYKTENCKTFSNTGQCPYGKRCRFVHQYAEYRADTPEEEVAQLQFKVQQINLSLAPNPVFPATDPSPPPSATKKGSRLPFLQKLRKL